MQTDVRPVTPQAPATPNPPSPSGNCWGGLRWWQFLIFGLVGNSLIALVLRLAGVHDNFYELWVTSQGIGFSITLLHGVIAMLAGVKRWKLWVTAVAVVAGVPLGVGVAALVCGPHIAEEFFGSWTSALRFLGFGAVFSLPFILFFEHRERIMELKLAQRAAELQLANEQRSALTAQLRLLQAQIEPHFLFNTLANVRSRIDHDPAEARDLLDQLNAHLRAGLQHSRATDTTLGEEFRLLESYLRIQSHRMGPRFQWQIHLPEELRAIPFPPMLIQPLVENAVRHGLEPKLGDGSLTLAARREANGLTITVIDDGLGLRPSGKPAGWGLANIRERLALLFGPEARLDLKENTGSGLTAALWIPLPALAR